MPEKNSTALEARLTGMIGAELDDLLLGARLDNREHWAKAQQPAGAGFDGSRSTARIMELLWHDEPLVGAMLVTQKAQEQGSTVTAGAELDGPWSQARQGRSEPCFYLRLV